jgi:hypothetical protein
MKTNEVKKASVKSEYQKEWNAYSNEKKTINKSLVDFANTQRHINSGTMFNKFCLACFNNQDGAPKTNKEINSKYYNAVKEFCGYGEIKTQKRGDTTIQFEQKCSEFIIFRFFWLLYKTWLAKNESK